MADAPFRIVIVGEGIAGSMAAAALTAALDRKRYDIRLVAAGEGGESFGPVEATLPSIREFHSRIGLDEDMLLRRTRAGFALGIAYTGWAEPGRSYFMPFGEVGAPLGPVAFHQLAGRLRQEGQAIRLADFSLAALAAQLGRFTRPLDDPRSPLSSYSYGFHVAASDYAAVLRAHAGVIPANASFSHAELASDGSIAAVVLDGGERIEGDLFIDGTGALIQALGTGFESWRQWLPCDRALALPTEAEGAPEPYSHIEALSGGWRRSVPIPGGRGEACLWASDHMDEQQALAAIQAGLAGRPLAQPKAVAFENGRRGRAWHRNCIAIGEAAVVLEPLQSTGPHLIQSALKRLIALFPNAADEPAEAVEYNRLTAAEAENARDFLVLRYKTNGRRGEPFWDACRAMPVPDTLQYKIDAYRSRGRVPLYDEELFDKADWVTLFDEQGVRPRRYDAMADGIPADQLRQHMTRLRDVVVRSAASLPLHGDYLRQMGARG